MADIIIKGMEMPSGCRECKLNNDTICALINGCAYDETDGSTRRPDCPLRPAPEWISAEERLPEPETYCLTLGERGAFRVCYFGVSLKHRGYRVFLDQNKKKVNPIAWKEITK